MLAAIICFSTIGILIGGIFTLFLINFDSKWKLILESILSMGGTGITLISLFKMFDITEQTIKFYTTTAFIFSFFVSTVLSMLIMCYVIKDKDDKDILRIRDVLLGQKSYIHKYYDKRMDEIDSKLNIKELKKRELAIEQKERSLTLKEQYISQEEQRITELGNKKLRIALPENKRITVTENFLNTLPSYIGDFSQCINEMKNNTDSFLSCEGKIYNVEDLKAYLLSFLMSVSNYIFGNSSNIRTHFRYYDEETLKYEMFLSIVGNNISDKSMTSIPYENSMIKKSYECKRVLIKSINSDYDYQSKNNKKWKDYMTFSFYNLTRNGKPFLTFGISVKNEIRFKDIFYFLNFVELETYLCDYIESVDQVINIAKIIYKKEDRSHV